MAENKKTSEPQLIVPKRLMLRLQEYQTIAIDRGEGGDEYIKLREKLEQFIGYRIEVSAAPWSPGEARSVIKLTDIPSRTQIPMDKGRALSFLRAVLESAVDISSERKTAVIAARRQEIQEKIAKEYDGATFEFQGNRFKWTGIISKNPGHRRLIPTRLDELGKLAATDIERLPYSEPLTLENIRDAAIKTGADLFRALQKEWSLPVSMLIEKTKEEVASRPAVPAGLVFLSEEVSRAAVQAFTSAEPIAPPDMNELLSAKALGLSEASYWSNYRAHLELLGYSVSLVYAPIKPDAYAGDYQFGPYLASAAEQLSALEAEYKTVQAASEKNKNDKGLKKAARELEDRIKALKHADVGQVFLVPMDSINDIRRQCTEVKPLTRPALLVSPSNELREIPHAALHMRAVFSALKWLMETQGRFSEKNKIGLKALEDQLRRFNENQAKRIVEHARRVAAAAGNERLLKELEDNNPNRIPGPSYVVKHVSPDDFEEKLRKILRDLMPSESRQVEQRGTDQSNGAAEDDAETHAGIVAARERAETELARLRKTLDYSHIFTIEGQALISSMLGNSEIVIRTLARHFPQVSMKTMVLRDDGPASTKKMAVGIKSKDDLHALEVLAVLGSLRKIAVSHRGATLKEADVQRAIDYAKAVRQRPLLDASKLLQHGYALQDAGQGIAISVPVEDARTMPITVELAEKLTVALNDGKFIRAFSDLAGEVGNGGKEGVLTLKVVVEKGRAVLLLSRPLTTDKMTKLSYMRDRLEQLAKKNPVLSPAHLEDARQTSREMISRATGVALLGKQIADKITVREPCLGITEIDYLVEQGKSADKAMTRCTIHFDRGKVPFADNLLTFLGQKDMESWKETAKKFGINPSNFRQEDGHTLVISGSSYAQTEQAAKAIAKFCGMVFQQSGEENYPLPMILSHILDGKPLVKEETPRIDGDWQIPKALRGVHATPVSAINDGQVPIVDAVNDPKIRYVVIHAPMGSGKTYIAVRHALWGMATGVIKKFIATRKPSTVHKAIGAVPGDQREKTANDNHAVFENTIQALKDMGVTEEEAVQIATKLTEKSKGSIPGREPFEIVLPAQLEGRGVEHTLFFLDEAQGITTAQMKSVLGRLKKGSKMIVVGDLRQADKAMRTKSFDDDDGCGLAYLINLLARSGNLDEIAFLGNLTGDDVVRDDAVRQMVIAQERYEQGLEERESGEPDVGSARGRVPVYQDILNTAYRIYQTRRARTGYRDGTKAANEPARPASTGKIADLQMMRAQTRSTGPKKG